MRSSGCIILGLYRRECAAAACIRAVIAEEVDTILGPAGARTGPACMVEPARLSRLAHQGRWVTAMAQQWCLCQATGRAWLRRFNTAHVVRAWVPAHPRLHLHYPPRPGRHLEAAERSWLQLMTVPPAERFYGSIQV
jgi:hypothetical protein